MRGANIPAPMKTRAKTERNADLAEQNLPQRQIMPETVARGDESPAEKSASVTKTNTAFTASAASRGSKFSETAQTGSSSVTVISTAATESNVERSPINEGRISSVDRVAHAITEQVVSFKRTGDRTLDVSMRPDRNTELSLHLTMRDGQVDVVARLERGQLESLQVHWGELQQKLAQQGVRVSQLTSSMAMGDQAQSQFWQHGSEGQTQRWFDQSPESLNEWPRGGAPAEPLHQRAHKPTSGVRRGWEMWA